MPLESGHGLLHYRLVEPIGEGGMGVVWKALDTSLEREVAIKLLPEAFGQDPERLSRFEREAKLLASLNHPNIAAAYGLHESDGVRFIAMELVGGEDLSTILSRGRLPLDEALDIARQVTLALETAHDNGVIHRDLKPANIRIDGSGNVKVLDFGLAKAFEADPSSSSVSLSLSPTLTSAGTVAGVILGTAAYMSPEQARAKPVDSRADVWALGVVLYEMLTGERLFDGETVSDILASVLKSEPDWTALPDETPRSVRRLLRRCLERDPRSRLHSAADARLELEDTEPEPEREVTAALPARPAWMRWAPWAVAAAALAIATAVLLRPAGDDDAPTALQRVIVPIDIGSPDLDHAGLFFALSPDGTQLAYAAKSGTSSQIYLRRLDELDAQPVNGTEGGHVPFFSPDGQWLGFFAGGDLLKLSLIGGRPQTMATVHHSPSGATWLNDGSIIFATAWTRAGLSRVAADGGDVEILTEPNIDAGETYHHRPQILPDQRHVLFVANVDATDRPAVLSLDSGEWRLLPEIEGQAHYVPSGHLIYGASETLLAVPFDVDRLETTGDPFAVIDGLPLLFEGAGGCVQISQTGVLAYCGAHRPQNQLTWIDRAAQRTPLSIQATIFDGIRISPDGRTVVTGGFTQCSIHSLESGVRLTQFDAFGLASWTPDGSHLIATAPSGQLHRFSVDGGVEPVPLLPNDRVAWGTSVSPDGHTLAYYEQDPETGRDIWLLDLQDLGAPQPFIVTPANERSAVFSPEGRYLAYASNRSGRDEVYVRRFEPRGERDTLVSAGGGREPVWGPDGRELFYRAGRALIAVPIELEPEFRTGEPETLFEGDWAVNSGGLNQMFQVSPDGERFLVAETPADIGRINVVVGWSPKPE